MAEIDQLADTNPSMPPTSSTPPPRRPASVRGAQGVQDAGPMTPEQRKAWEAKRQEHKFRRLRRKAREAEGEIEDLNITPMLDMMTIILVFLLKSYNTSTVSVAISNDLLPPTSSTTLEPAETTTVTVTKTEITVGDKPAVALANFEVPASATNPRAPLIITPVLDLLKKDVERQKFIGKWNKSVQFEGLLSIIGDKGVPYKLLFSVLATAGQAELGNYKFIVLKQGQ
jgi:biopolymer transport protein ExbD